jgi:hypothetical protein
MNADFVRNFRKIDLAQSRVACKRMDDDCEKGMPADDLDLPMHHVGNHISRIDQWRERQNGLKLVCDSKLGVDP